MYCQIAKITIILTVSKYLWLYNFFRVRSTNMISKMQKYIMVPNLKIGWLSLDEKAPNGAADQAKVPALSSCAQMHNFLSGPVKRTGYYHNHPLCPLSHSLSLSTQWIHYNKAETYLNIFPYRYFKSKQ